MTWHFPDRPASRPGNPVTLVLTPRARDIGAFDVKRALPDGRKRMIGPFIFFDQMGPVVLEGDRAMDVRPHPHIGLSTITWLFEGEIRHRDSLGNDRVIKPGAVNWMTAGSGIVHSERSPQHQRGVNARLGGIQAWVALPRAEEECEPAFYHYDANQIPRYDENGIGIALIVGDLFGQRSPVLTLSPTLYAEIRLTAGRALVIPALAGERGLYVYDGELVIAGTNYQAGSMLVLAPDGDVELLATADCTLMLLGGARLDGDRHIDWNFVSSRPERIEQAKDDWRNDRFDRVPGDDEFIPLPD